MDFESGNKTTDEGTYEVPLFGASFRGVDLRARVFDFVGPTYIIDTNGRFLDWNPAFEEVISIPLKLVRHQAIADFHVDRQQSQNSGELNEVAVPLVPDQLELVLPEYGVVAFHKIIGEILDDTGEIVAWSVHLIVIDAELAVKVWSCVLNRIKQSTNWSKYATVYDALLLKFSEYSRLLDKVATQLVGAKNCIDLGAGTGNSAIALLRSDPSRLVCAVDANEFMLDRLRHKLSSMIPSRLTVYQCDIHSMPCFPDERFDGASMVNTLYALDDPASCLREVCRIIKSRGMLVLTSPHRQTSVDRLFTSLRDDLKRQGIFEAHEEAFWAARERHDAMDSQIHRFEIEEIRTMIESSGFDIESMSSEYADAVMLIKAFKR